MVSDVSKLQRMCLENVCTPNCSVPSLVFMIGLQRKCIWLK